MEQSGTENQTELLIVSRNPVLNRCSLRLSCLCALTLPGNMQLHDTNSGSSAGTLSAIKDPLTCLNHAGQYECFPGQSQFAISLSALTAQVLIYLRRRPPVPSLILTNGSSDAMTPNHALLGIAVLLYALHRLLYPAHADNNPSQRLSDLIVAGIACQVIDSLSDYGVV